jgi:hypothetical protein
MYITGSVQGIQCIEIQDEELACRLTVTENIQVRTLH